MIDFVLTDSQVKLSTGEGREEEKPVRLRYALFTKCTTPQRSNIIVGVAICSKVALYFCIYINIYIDKRGMNELANKQEI